MVIRRFDTIRTIARRSILIYMTITKALYSTMFYMDVEYKFFLDGINANPEGFYLRVDSSPKFAIVPHAQYK